MSLTTLKTKLLAELTASDQSNRLIAVSFAVGVFITLSPFWGAQNLIAIAVAVLFKLNKVVVLITANLSSIPPLIPVIFFMGYQTGSLVITGEFTKNIPDINELKELESHFFHYFVGAIVSGALLSLLAFVGMIISLGLARTKS